MKTCKIVCAAAVMVICLAVFPAGGWAKSAYSPRHTGMEPPGGPKKLDALPGATPGRTPEGGLGHIDAYGNTIRNREPEQKQPHKRLRPGAYGIQRKQEPPARLPDLPSSGQTPVWKFQ